MIFVWEEGNRTDKNQSTQVLNQDLPIKVFVLEAYQEYAIGLENLNLVQVVSISAKVDKYYEWESQDNKTYEEGSKGQSSIEVCVPFPALGIKIEI